jgi:Arc/MetJ-type ribon-helix-helix transcriptional regulator
MQSEPTAFDNAELRAAQRRGALAVVHGENDSVVAFTQGKAGFESFDDDGFPAVRLFSDKTAGHMFARLPVERAIRWLEQVTSDDPASLLKFAQDRVKAGEYRDATAALRRLVTLESQFEAAAVQALKQQIDNAAEPAVKRLQAMISASQDDSWVPDFIAFRVQFQFADAAQPVMKAYQQLRAEHEAPATKHWNSARQEFQKGNQNAGYAHYEEIVKKYYASSWYRYAKPAVDRRKSSEQK